MGRAPARHPDNGRDMWILIACAPAPDTDPEDRDTDVAVAAPYVPQFDGYPRLFDPDSRDDVVTRLAGTGSGGPQILALVAQVEGQCARATDPPDGASPGAWWSGAADARACAFLAWTRADAAAAAKAEKLLAGMPDDAGLVSRDDDTHLATALALEVQAWDLLAGSGLAVDPDAAAAPVIALARSTHQRYAVDGALQLLLSQSNHNLKLGAAIAMAGLVFDDEPDAAAWFGFGSQEIARLYSGGFDAEALTTPAGGFGEGPYYQSYSDFQVIPFARARHRLVPGDVVVAPHCLTWPAGTCPEGAFVVEDPWTSPSMRAAWDWNLGLRRPDGHRAPIDDSVAIGHPSALLAEIDPIYGWDWASLSPPHVVSAGDVAVDVLAGWDGAMAAPTGARCDARPEVGTAVIASGWGPDDAWALLLGESSGPMTPTGHEHTDAGTFQAMLHGVTVALDPGYAGWTLRDHTSTYVDHNGITVDGVAPKSGYLSDVSVAWDVADPCAPEATLTIEGVAWSRRLHLDGHAVVVADRLVGAAGHTLVRRLHVETRGGRGTVAPRPWGWLLSRADQTFAIVVAGGGEGTVETGEDAPVYAKIAEHDVLVTTLAATADVDWTTVIVGVSGEPVVTVDGGAITVDGRRF